MIFDKSSTRTRVSFEAGMTQLGGQSLFLSEKDIQLGRGEPITDSAIVISSMVDAVMLRLSSHEDIVEFSKHSSKPVINALSDESHPCQILADLMTYQEKKGQFKEKRLPGLEMDAMSVKPICRRQEYLILNYQLQRPVDMSPLNCSLKNIQKNINFYSKPYGACENADIVVTDVWTSMGQESEKKQRESSLRAFRSDQNMMNQAKKDAIFMHCLPAYRGKEVSSEVIDGNQSVVWSEAENRLHVQKSLLIYLIED